jgi:hypothetical protein
MPEVELKVMLFAAAREAAGKAEFVLTCSTPTTGGELLSVLITAEPT